jgi:hypothetical protein
LDTFISTGTRQFQNRRNRYGIRNPDLFEYRYIFRTQSFNRIAEVIPNFLRVIRYYIRVISRMYPLWRFTFKNSRYSREVSRKSFRVFLFCVPVPIFQTDASATEKKSAGTVPLGQLPPKSAGRHVHRAACTRWVRGYALLC